MDTFDMLQKILRTFFYLLALAALVGFFMQSFMNHPNNWWMYCGVGAIACSLIRFFLRMM